jgi:predicted RNase H-like nuclease (RuvC/YqgF family)
MNKKNILKGTAILVIGLIVGFLITPYPDISEYEEQINSLKTQNENLESQVESLQTDISDREAQIKNLPSISEFNSLENLLSEKESNIESLIEQIDEKEEKILELESQITELNESKIEYEYIGSIESNIYHYPNCHHVEKIEQNNLVYFASVQGAINSGYRACKDCTPP